jgi:hypothetical protein
MSSKVLSPNTHKNHFRWFNFILVLFMSFTLCYSAALAQDEDEVQVNEIHGRLEPNRYLVYLIPDLKAGQTLYIYLETTSGNLDPVMGLISTQKDPMTVLRNYQDDMADAIEKGEDPLVAIPKVYDQHFLAWDDDSGDGYSAALQYTVPEDGGYRLFVGAALSSLKIQTFGDYRLSVGLDAPEALEGTAETTDDKFIFFDEFASPKLERVQETIGSLTEDQTNRTIRLNNFDKGDTLYVYVEPTSGDLVPSIALLDFGDKPIRSGNAYGTQSVAKFEYTFSKAVQNYSLIIGGCCDAKPTTGSYRMLLGINQPDILSGQADETGDPLIKQPIEVGVGLKLQQITGIDQKSENYGAVVSLKMEWTDPALGFSPDSCDCSELVYTGTRFDDFVDDIGDRWPEFTLSNQQGNRWIQNQVVVLEPDGHAVYFERFTTLFQAPDFNFRMFPFDQQKFFIRIDSLYPDEFYSYYNLGDYTEVGSRLGEEEWVVIDQSTSVSSQVSNTLQETSSYSFQFKAKRHLDYYMTRIFAPILLILLVSWITFFLRDFTKRIDVTSANLLAFIAFNFTVSNDLPRLGYLTFLDMILLATFITSVVIILYNVGLRFLEVRGKKDLAVRIDRFAIWIYPIGYILAFWFVYYLYASGTV